MIKVAFIGRQRSGKTTGAEALKLHVLSSGGFDWEKTHVYMTSFGKAMKEQFERFTGEKFDKKEHRKMIQLFGQLHRRYQDNIWISYVQAELLNAERKDYSHFIVDDVRQANEVKWCKDNGFILIYIDVPLITLHRRCIDLGEDFTPSHPTEMVEQFYMESDLRITNDGDKKEFEQALVDTAISVIESRGELDEQI